MGSWGRRPDTQAKCALRLIPYCPTAIRKTAMSFNTFGHLFRVTTWGESHGPALGCVVDGCPPGIALPARRHPGRTRPAPPGPVAVHHAAPGGRRGRDPFGRACRRGRRRNLVDHRHADLDADRATPTSARRIIPRSATSYRPGHADYHLRSEIRHPRLSRRRPLVGARDGGARGGRRALARRVVPGLTVRGALMQVGSTAVDREPLGLGEVGANDFFCPDAEAAAKWAEYLTTVRKNGSSVGAVDRDRRRGRAARARRADLRQARPGHRRPPDVDQRRQGRRDRRRLGGRGAERRGKCRRDPHRTTTASRVFLSNHAGGILGGISTGQPVVARFAVKPTSSILTPRRSINAKGEEIDVSHQGPARPLRRHPRRTDRRSDGRLRDRRPLSSASRPDGEGLSR